MRRIWLESGVSENAVPDSAGIQSWGLEFRVPGPGAIMMDDIQRVLVQQAVKWAPSSDPLALNHKAHVP